jgi:predicted AAA+ superfamily ATPase
VVRPFAKNPQREITAMPKVYGFDTGFVCYSKGWRELRMEDMGLLWEHLVLDELKARFAADEIFYWRDKQKHEMDFVVARRGCRPVALECKWKLQGGSRVNFASFSMLYPEAKLVVVASDAGSPRINRTKGFVETGLCELERAISLANEMPLEIS